MHCNGKCQVIKKIKEEEKKDQENSEKRNAKFEVLSNKSFYPIMFAPEFINGANVKIAAPYHLVITSFSLDFFHPPQAI